MTGNVHAVRLDEVETFGDANKMEMLRIEQLIVLPANSIGPDINTVLRGLVRLSMKTCYAEILKQKRAAKAEASNPDSPGLNHVSNP